MNIKGDTIILSTCIGTESKLGQKFEKPEQIVKHEEGRWCDSKFKASDWKTRGNHKKTDGGGEQAFLVGPLNLAGVSSVPRG